MFCIDEGCNATFLLALCDGMNGQCGLTRRLWTVNLNDTSFWIAANTQCCIQTDGASRDAVDFLDIFFTETHDGTMSIVLLDFCHCCLQGFQFLFVWICHILIYYWFSIYYLAIFLIAANLANNYELCTMHYELLLVFWAKFFAHRSPSMPADTMPPA